jgi:nucleotide-binding universal stress UspA family protein
MSHRYIVGVDDSKASIRAAHYAVKNAAKSGASIKILHVLEWSPYSFLTLEEQEERHRQHGKELKRTKSALIDPIVNELTAASKNVSITGKVCYGQAAKELNQYCDEMAAEKIFIGRNSSGTLSTRLFGSVPSALLQCAKVPVTVVP